MEPMPHLPIQLLKEDEIEEYLESLSEPEGNGTQVYEYDKIEYLDEDEDIVIDCIVKEEPAVAGLQTIYEDEEYLEDSEQMDEEVFTKSDVDSDEVYDEILDIKNIDFSTLSSVIKLKSPPTSNFIRSVPGSSTLEINPFDIPPTKDKKKSSNKRIVDQVIFKDFKNEVPKTKVHMPSLTQHLKKKVKTWTNTVQTEKRTLKNKKLKNLVTDKTIVERKIGKNGALQIKTVQMEGKVLKFSDLVTTSIPMLNENYFRFHFKEHVKMPTQKKEYTIQKDYDDKVFVYSEKDGSLDEIQNVDGDTLVKYQKTVCCNCKALSLKHVKIKLRCPLCCLDVTRSEEFLEHLEKDHDKKKYLDKKYFSSVNFVTRTLQKNEKLNSTVKPSKNKNLKIQCDDCGKLFA